MSHRVKIPKCWSPELSLVMGAGTGGTWRFGWAMARARHLCRLACLRQHFAERDGASVGEEQPVIARLTRDGRVLINDRHPFGIWWHDGTAYCAKVPLHVLRHEPLASIVGVDNQRQLRRLIAAVVRESPRWSDLRRWGMRRGGT